MPKGTLQSGDPLTLPVSLVYHSNDPPRRSMRAGIRSGLNHNHLPLSIRLLAVCFLPAASTTKEMGGAGSSPRMRVLLAPGSTHSARQVSPATRYTFRS